MEKNKEVMLTLFVMALLVMNSSIIFAQQQHNNLPMLPDEEGIARMIEEMAKELSLTEEQKNTIIDLQKEHYAQLQKLMEAGKTQREEMRAKHEQLRLGFENGMRAVMQNEQLKKFEEFLKKLETRPGKQVPKRDGQQGRR